MKTCKSCHHYRYYQTGRRIDIYCHRGNEMPEDARDCPAYDYAPGTDEEEDGTRWALDNLS